MKKNEQQPASCQCKINLILDDEDNLIGVEGVSSCLIHEGLEAIEAFNDNRAWGAVAALEGAMATVIRNKEIGVVIHGREYDEATERAILAGSSFLDGYTVTFL